MNHVLCGIAILLATMISSQADSNSALHSLSFTASKPQVQVLGRSGRRDYLHLPSLEYTFILTARCGADFEPHSVSLSIADKFRSLPTDQLVDLATGAELKMTVPAKQLAPLAIENFCVKNDAEKDAENAPVNATASIRAAFSAQASLICTNEQQQQQITYASNPLDIVLICAAADDRAE